MISFVQSTALSGSPFFSGSSESFTKNPSCGSRVIGCGRRCNFLFFHEILSGYTLNIRRGRQVDARLSTLFRTRSKEISNGKFSKNISHCWSMRFDCFILHIFTLISKVLLEKHENELNETLWVQSHFYVFS